MVSQSRVHQACGAAWRLGALRDSLLPAAGQLSATVMGLGPLARWAQGVHLGEAFVLGIGFPLEKARPLNSTGSASQPTVRPRPENSRTPPLTPAEGDGVRAAGPHAQGDGRGHRPLQPQGRAWSPAQPPSQPSQLPGGQPPPSPPDGARCTDNATAHPVQCPRPLPRQSIACLRPTPARGTGLWPVRARHRPPTRGTSSSSQSAHRQGQRLPPGPCREHPSLALPPGGLGLSQVCPWVLSSLLDYSRPQILDQCLPPARLQRRP